MARNLTDSIDGFLLDSRYLTMDRDSKFCEAFRDFVEQSGVKCLRLPPRCPNLNPHIERFHKSLKNECTHRMIFFGEKSLLKAMREYLAHYHRERNHQGLDNKLIELGEEVHRKHGSVRCRERLGGMLRYYYREAA